MPVRSSIVQGGRISHKDTMFEFQKNTFRNIITELTPMLMNHKRLKKSQQGHPTHKNFIQKKYTKKF